MANPNKNTKPAAVAPVTPEVTAEVEVIEATVEATVEPVAEGIPARPLFTTTVEDAPPVSALPAKVRLTPKTLAEMAAGKEAISQYS